MDAILKRYQSILQIYNVQQIIKNLNQTKQTATFFTDTIKELQTLHLNRETGTIVYKHQPNENILEMNKGTYGKIYRSDNPLYVYKEIVFDYEDPIDIEFNVREVFLELFIQTVLANDPLYGRHICKIYTLYRSENSYKLPRPFSLFIKMEFLTIHICNHLFQYTKSLSLQTITPFFVALCTILDGLEKRYKFRHRDLHTYNVMVHEQEIKLIDCNFSRIEYEGITYSLEQNVIVKQTDTTVLKTVQLQPQYVSHDMLIFLASFLQNCSNNLATDKDRTFLRSLFRTNNGTNLYEYWQKETKRDVFHMFYDWIIVQDWPKELQQEYEASSANFTPDKLREKLKNNPALQ
jgi:hypothetical protein